MRNFTEIDANFKVETKINKDDIVFHNALNSPFEIYGVFYENGRFRRMPETVAKTVSDGVYGLHAVPAGGRLRFKTNSPYVAISAVLDNIVDKVSNCSVIGLAGFDLYIREGKEECCAGTFVPPWDIKNRYESIIEFESKTLKEITINFPTGADVTELYIGLSEGSVIEKPTPYMTKAPIVYYGSSITQGGCASRPGLSYQNLITKMLDYDYINLGFSGSAKGEQEIADYIKKLDMSVFVYDYDYNAPTAEHLAATHEPMFKAIREENPDLPIIIMSRPKYSLNSDEKERLNIIETTYKNAVNAGDKNVYFLSGTDLMKMAKSEGLVDGIHPNDLGFASMANALAEVLKQILN